MASRKISDLIPEAQRKYYEFQAAMAKKVLLFLVTCTFRSQAEQDVVWLQGRESLAVVNAARKALGLPPLTDKENVEVTWTHQSAHLQRIAWDIALLDNGGKPTWNLKVDVNADEIPDYKEAAQIGRELGLMVGADFPHPDYPHFQLIRT